ncbi:MAG: VWA domain-containing protein [Planctomycetota bacterium]
MLSVEHTGLLLLAPVAGLCAWFLATRGRRRGALAGIGAALSAMLIVVALAGVFVSRGSALRVFIVDVSASARDAPAALLPQIRAAAAQMRPADRIAVVAFGRDAAVLLPPTPVAELPARLPAPAGIDQSGTSIEAAFATAAALLPEGAAGDIVLLTDGRENVGDAAARAAALGRPVHSLTLLTAPEKDAWIEAVRAPSAVAAGQDVDFEVLAGATKPMRGKLILLLDGRELARPESIDVIGRQIVLARRVRAAKPGLHTLTARLLCEGDSTSENDSASAAVRVRGKLNVTYVSSGEAPKFAGIIERSAAITLRRTSPEALVATNDEMLASDVIVLDDVPAKTLRAERIEWVRRLVLDAGRGLIVFGGRNSFGPGGYAETPLAALLPVDVDPERKAGKPTSAVIVADRSGSMAAMLGGRQKIEFVREAVLCAGTEFGARSGKRPDELGVVAFNQRPEVLLERLNARAPGGPAKLRAAAGRIFPSGRTDIGPALDAARAILVKSDLKRHIILVSDGRSQDKLDGRAISEQMKAAGIVLSVLATEAAMNEGLAALKTAAGATGGRFVTLESISELPAAMARETRRITDSLIREGEFSVERGPGGTTDEMPAPIPIRGYVLTAARSEAPPMFVIGDAPVIAQWRRGLGRIVACATSLDEWATEWAKADPKLFTDLVLWAGGSARQRVVAVSLELEGGRFSITANAGRPLGKARLVASVFSPAGGVSKIEMRQAGRQRYDCSADGGKRGTYVAKISDAKTGEVLGEGHVTVGYGPEWRPAGDASAAGRLSRLTGGVILEGLRDLPPLETPSSGGARVSIAHILLCLAAAAFLITSLR